MSAAVDIDSYAENRRLSFEMASVWGTIERETLPSGNVRFRVNLGIVAVNGVKKRRRISTGPSPHFMPLEGEKDAQVELARIRARAIGGESKSSIVADYLESEASQQLFETWLDLYVEHFRHECHTADKSWNSFRDVLRWAHEGDASKPRGYWRWWDGKDIRRLTNADGTAYAKWLADQPSRSNKAAEGDLVGAKTRKNVIHGLVAMLQWSSGEAATGAGLAWEIPIIKSPKVVRPATLTCTPEQTRAILDDIPWEIRGGFLAQAYETVRFSTMRAANLDEWNDERELIHWHSAMQGARLTAPVRDQKNHAVRLRRPFDDELVRWLHWRFAQETPEDRMAGRARALFWNTGARNRDRRWTYDAFRNVWRRYALPHGVTASPGAGTRHSTLSRVSEVLTDSATRDLSMHAPGGSLPNYQVGTAANADVMSIALGRRKTDE